MKLFVFGQFYDRFSTKTIDRTITIKQIEKIVALTKSEDEFELEDYLSEKSVMFSALAQYFQDNKRAELRFKRSKKIDVEQEEFTFAIRTTKAKAKAAWADLQSGESECDF